MTPRSSGHFEMAVVPFERRRQGPVMNWLERQLAQGVIGVLQSGMYNNPNRAIQQEIIRREAAPPRPPARPRPPSTVPASKRPRISFTSSYVTRGRKRVKRKLTFKKRIIGRSKYRRTGRRRAKRSKKIHFGKMGTILRREIGGIGSSSGVVYIGHSNSPIKMLWRAFGEALIKKIMITAKLSFVSWDDTILDGVTNGFNIVISYKDVVDQTVGSNTVTPGATDTYNQLANTVTNALLGLIGTAQNKFEITNIYVKNQVGGTGTAIFPSMKFRAADLKVHVSSLSQFKMQNLTQNSSSATDLTAQNNMFDIRNNPVHGKMYSKRGNYMNTKFYEHGGTNPPVFIGENVDGLVSFASNDVAFTTKMQQLLKNPPPKNFFEGKVMTAPCALGPGHIKYSVIRTDKVYTLNGFIQSFLWGGRLFNTLASMDPIAGVPTQRVPHSFGGIKVYAFEKVMDQRTDEPNTNIAYEVCNTMMMAITGSSPVASQPNNNY